jgi:hypothetical protein
MILREESAGVTSVIVAGDKTRLLIDPRITSSVSDGFLGAIGIPEFVRLVVPSAKLHTPSKLRQIVSKHRCVAHVP